MRERTAINAIHFYYGARIAICLSTKNGFRFFSPSHLLQHMKFNENDAYEKFLLSELVLNDFLERLKFINFIEFFEK
jgi:hypothetical protein